VPDTVQLIGNYRGAILPGGHSHSFPRYPRTSRRVSLSLRRSVSIVHRVRPISTIGFLPSVQGSIGLGVTTYAPGGNGVIIGK
jgi:hypothetical protein